MNTVEICLCNKVCPDWLWSLCRVPIGQSEMVTQLCVKALQRKGGIFKLAKTMIISLNQNMFFINQFLSSFSKQKKMKAALTLMLSGPGKGISFLKILQQKCDGTNFSL